MEKERPANREDGGADAGPDNEEEEPEPGGGRQRQHQHQQHDQLRHSRNLATRILLLASIAVGSAAVIGLTGGGGEYYGGGRSGLLRRRGIIRPSAVVASPGWDAGDDRQLLGVSDSSAQSVSDDGSCNVDCCAAMYPQLDLGELSGISIASTSRSLQAEGDGSSANATTTNDCPGEADSVTSNLPTAVTWILVVFLVCMSALFSGLTLGLMGLDVTGLEIVMEGDDPELSRAAKKIYPVRKNGNRLLCTLLLGNVAVNALLSILMADVAGGLAGFLVSTAVIVIFGEILPQAACSRYALQIGSRAIPLIKVIMCLMLPLSAPMGWALDKMLGHELGTTYSKAEMTKLLEIHVKEGRFNEETGTAMAGALLYQDIAVKEVMTPIDNAYMLAADTRLGYDVIAEIFKTGFSRIPVYEVSKNNVIGLLFTKDLIFIDPEDETPVRSFVEIFGRGLHVVWTDDRLGDVLRDLKKGHSHMALAREVNNDDSTQDPYYEIRGIITLEDIIEVILGDDIVDETDAFVDATHSIKVDRSSADFDWARLRLLDSKLVDETLADEEVKAVTAHLRTNYADAVELLSEGQLRRLVAQTPVTQLQEAKQEVGESLPTDLLYEKDKPADCCTLILSGKVTVLAGAENFRADVSSWSVLAPNALTDPNFSPDFTAYVSSDPCRVLCFSRHDFLAAVDASAVEKYGHATPVTVARSDSGAAGGGDRTEHSHSVTVDTDNKDVVIGLGDKSRSDLVIDVDQFDGVKILFPSAPGAEGGDVKLTCTADGEEATATAAAPQKSVVFAVQEKPAGPPVSAKAKAESAEDVVAKRELKRKQHQRHRSKLLAAFMKKRSDHGDEIDETETKGDNEEPKDEPPKQDQASTPVQGTSPPANNTSALNASAQSSATSTSEVSGRDRSGSVGFLKELSVRQPSNKE